MAVQPPVVIVETPRQPGCLVTLLWFIFIGWWASLLWTIGAWVFIGLILTMPIGLKMINVLPKVATLREPTREYSATISSTATSIQRTGLEQRPFLLRALYFILIGWWLSFAVLVVAWAASLTLLGIPLAIWLYNRVPAVTTLRRY